MDLDKFERTGMAGFGIGAHSLSPETDHFHDQPQGPDEPLYALWDELSDFGAHATDAALRHCMQRVCAWIGADDAFWLGTVRAPGLYSTNAGTRGGWRIGAIETLAQDRKQHKRLRSSLKAQHPDNSPLAIDALVAGAGLFRVQSLYANLTDLQPFHKRSHGDRIYQQAGISDRLWVAFPASAHTESCFCFDLLGPRRHFDVQTLRTVGRIFRGLKWFHRELLLSHGLTISGEPIPPAVRRVLNELLSGATEKSIAKRLRITPASAHQYVKTLFRHFDVHGRAEFMSLWLNGRS
jgi:hypothetical protein